MGWAGDAHAFRGEKVVRFGRVGPPPPPDLPPLSLPIFQCRPRTPRPAPLLAPPVPWELVHSACFASVQTVCARHGRALACVDAKRPSSPGRAPARPPPCSPARRGEGPTTLTRPPSAFPHPRTWFGSPNRLD
jgi:hypothetical protein